MLGRRPPPPQQYTTRVREQYHIEDVSSAYRLLTNKDFSVLPAESRTTASWKTLLHAVSQLCTEELFKSCVLSRNMLSICDDISTLFHRLCTDLGRRHVLDEVTATRRQDAPRELEEVVTMPLLPFLDCLNLDGSITVSEDTADMVQRENAKQALLALGENGSIEGYCRRAAAVFSSHFELNDVEEYSTLPTTPQWVSLEFGGYASPRTEDISDEAIDMSGDLLVMMMQSNGPLDGAKLVDLEDFIIDEPSVLSIGGYGIPTELCTLLHQAAAGPAHDRRLVEWLIQMDALHYQPKHLRNPRASGLLKAGGQHEKAACNTLAVHSAAKAGHFDIVRLILEAEHLRDINTVTYHTRESLAHIVVKYGHRHLFEWLLEMGVDVRNKDASGKYVVDLTDDVAWKRRIRQAVAHQQREDEIQRGFKNREAKQHQEYLAAAEKQRQMLEKQRESELTGWENAWTIPTEPTVPSSTNIFAVASTAAPSSVAKRTKTKTKTKPTKKKTPSVKDEAAVTELMETLAVSSVASVDPAIAIDRIEQLSLALDTLQKGSAVCETEREDSAVRALMIVDKLKSTTLHLATSKMHSETTPGTREQLALEASRALFLLSKYHRQLPEPPKRLRRAPAKTPDPDTSKLSSIEKLHRRAGSPSHFVDFLSFAIQTSRLLVSCGRTPQAIELLELVERRLLKIKPRSPDFRSLVVLLVGARREIRLTPAVGSTTEAQRTFEWYASCPQGIENDGVLQLLDMLRGQACFLRLKCVEAFDSFAFCRFSDLVDGVGGPRHEELQGMVYIDNYVVAGAESHKKLMHKFNLIMVIAQMSGLHFYPDRMHVGEEKMPLVGYVFSATEIVRAN